MAALELKEILTARETRSRRIKSFLVRYRLPLIVLTLNIPGPDKTPKWAEQVFSAGIRAARETFSPMNEKTCRASSGFEWYGVVEGESLSLKKAAVGIEEAHPLGRLFDLDLHVPDTSPPDRRALGLEPRRCLACDRPAHECARSRRHELDELLRIIQVVIEAYTSEQGYTLQK